MAEGEPLKFFDSDLEETNLLSLFPLRLPELRLKPAEIELFILRPYSNRSFPYCLDTGIGVLPIVGGAIQCLKGFRFGNGRVSSQNFIQFSSPLLLPSWLRMIEEDIYFLNLS